MPTLTVIVLAKDEAANIRDCLASAAGADELLVVDDGSGDATAALAAEAGAKVITRRLSAFDDQRNFALAEAAGDWVFFLDADERFSPGLLPAIRRHMETAPPRAGAVTRHNFAFGRRRPFGPLKADRVTRLFPRGGVRWQGQVHERPVFDGPAARLGGHLEHHTYRDWGQYLDKQTRYAEMWAASARARGRTATVGQALAHGLGGFFKMLFLNLGLLGGPVAWAMCACHGLYTLTKYLRLSG